MGKLTVPKIGGRTFKTLISVTALAFIYGVLDRNACFACIGGVFGLGNTMRNGIRSGGNRFIGTFVGSMIALPFFWLYHNDIIYIPEWIYLALGILVVIHVCQALNIQSAIQPASVMFFVTIYTIPESTYFSYAIARVIDTGIGVAFSLLINRIWPSPYETIKHNEVTLHQLISSADDEELKASCSSTPLDMTLEG